MAPIAVPAALSVIGFTSGGVVGGSIAAGMMSSVGNVAAGSAIATMQSIGAAGLGATGTAVGGVVSGAVGSVVAKIASKGKNEKDTGGCEEHDNICDDCKHCKCKHVKM